MADAPAATSGGSQWQGLISDAIKGYAAVETAKANRGVAGAVEDTRRGLASVPAPANPQAAGQSYTAGGAGGLPRWAIYAGAGLAVAAVIGFLVMRK